MNRRIKRAVAGGIAAAVLWSQCAINASAEIEAPLLNVENCLDRAPGVDGRPPVDAWHLERLEMERVWPIATGRGVKVAVIDTGTSTAGTSYLPPDRIHSYNFLPPSDEDVNLECDHGTAVTSILAAGRAEDGRPLHPATNFSGIAPDAEVLAFRTLVGEGENDGNLAPMVAAFRAAIDEDVDVINYSQIAGGRDPHFAAFQQVVEEAIDAGIVVVAAAGNQSHREAGFIGDAYPAGFERVISVGATNFLNEADPLTISGQKIDIGAPGHNILAAWPSKHAEAGSFTTQTQAFAQRNGTSYAAPIVSGVVALMIENHRRVHGTDMTPAEVFQRLIETADPPPTKGKNRLIGWGTVNPLRALSDPLPLPTPSAEETVAAVENPFPEPEPRDELPMQVGLGMAVGAAALTAFGLAAAIAIPAARRNAARRDG